MMLRWTVLFCLFFFAAHSAVVQRNIPVEIVYDRSNNANYGTRNLDAKIQLTPEELLKLKLSDDIINDEKIDEEIIGNPYGVRNLDEKVQLSPEELKEAEKPSSNSVEAEDNNVKAVISPETGNSETSEPHHFLALITRAEEIAYNGINTIRDNIDKTSETVAGVKPSVEAWERLNQTLQEFFRDQYKSVLSLKQEQPANQNQNPNPNQNQFMQNLINGFQNITNNFMSTYFPQNGQNGQNGQKPSGSEDEQQQPNQGPFQNLINFFQGGMAQVINNMNNLNNQNSTNGQEDTGSGPDGGSNGGFFGNVVNQIQQFFNQANQGSNPPQTPNVNQSADTGVQPTTNAPGGPGGFLQGAINQFNQVVNNFRPSTTSRPPVQGDEGTVSSTTQGNFIQSIGQAFQNVNIFRPPNQNQGGSGGSNGGSSGGPSNPIQGIGSQIGQAFGQGGNGSNPLQGIGQAFGGNGSNPLQGIGGQFQGGSNGGSGSNPLQQGAQAIGGQFQQFLGQGQGGNKPVEGGSAEATTEKTRSEEKNEEKKETQTEKKPVEMMIKKE